MYVAYNILQHGPGFALDVRQPFGYLPQLDIGSWLQGLGEQKDFDLNKLLMAMIASYIVLKIDVEDVVSATKAVTTGLTSAIPIG